MESDAWSSLEVVKLVVAALGPLAVIVLGYVVSRLLKRLEAVQWANQTVIKRRLDIFSDVAPKLNKIYCFSLFIGPWKQIRPADVIDLKRQVDEVMHTNRVLFSPELFEAYLRLMKLIFDEYALADRDAPLRVPIDEGHLGSRRSLPWWDPSLEAAFATIDIPTTDEVRTTYQTLSTAFQHDLYVTRAELSLPSA